MPPSHQVTHAALTDTGVKRPYNQDSFAAQPATDTDHWSNTGHIFVVADGMGGHAVGEKASAKAVRDIPLTFTKHVGQEGPAPAIRRAFTEANQAIYQIGQNNPEFKGLGTTGTAIFLRPEGVWVGHVGDSRAYRIRGDRVQQLTFDHSWVWEVARRQGVDPDDLGDFKKNVIIRSLGPDAEVEVDIEGPFPVEPGDIYLLCSDGLSNLVKPDEIGAVVTSLSPDEAAKFLIELANLRGGPDNITAVIIKVPGHPKASSGAKSGLIPIGKLPVPALSTHWPLVALGGGLLAGALAVAIKVGLGTGAALATLLLAFGLVVAGIVGLVRMYRHHDIGSGTVPDLSPDGTPRPAFHREHSFAINETMACRFDELETSLRDVLEGKDVGADWDAYKRHTVAAADAAKSADWPAAFRERCFALQELAMPFNKLRHKEEAFQPNWLKDSDG